MSFASPSVFVKEVDNTALTKVSNYGLSVIILDAEIGPVDTLIQIDSEKTLYDTFGKPNDHNYEAWFAISTVIKYGGIVGVIRPSISTEEYKLTNANIQKPERVSGISYDQNLLIKNQDDFDSLNPKEFLFSARYAGEYYNDIIVSIVDHGADQIISFSGTIVVPNTGDLIRTGSGKEAIVYATGQNLTITLFDSTQRFELGESVYDQDGDLIGTIDEVIVNRVYDTLDCVPGLKWSSFVNQPDTSEYTKNRSGKFDEFHIAVIDSSGKITGTPNSILETFPFVSKAKDCRSSDGRSLFWRNVINQRSKYLYVGDDQLLIYDSTVPSFYNVTMRDGSTEIVSATRAITRQGVVYFNNNANNPFSELLYYQTGSEEAFCGNIEDAARLNYFGIFRNLASGFVGTPVFNFKILGGQSYNYENPDLVHADIVAAYDVFSDRTQFGDIDFILPGRISSDMLVKLVQIVEERKDCLTVCSTSKDSVINNAFDTIKVENILSFFKTLPTSTYAIFDSGWKKIYDKFNDEYRYVPCAADIAGLCIRTSRTNEDWFSPAGYIRGILIDGTGLYFSPNRSEAFRLYKNGINPIVNFKGIGTVLFGDKTSRVSRSAFHYIGVRRLFLQLERDIERMSKFFLFEFNDQTGRTAYTDAVNGYLRGIQGKRGIYDFKIVCDESNNDFDVIDQNGLNVDIYINPSRTINCIEIKLIVTSTGVSFNEFEEASAVGSECDNPYDIQESEPVFVDLPPDPEEPVSDDAGVFIAWLFDNDAWDTERYFDQENRVAVNKYRPAVLFSQDGTEHKYLNFPAIHWGPSEYRPYLSDNIYDQNRIWNMEYETDWTNWTYQASGPIPHTGQTMFVPHFYRIRQVLWCEFMYQHKSHAPYTRDIKLSLPINKNGCVSIAWKEDHVIEHWVKYRIEKQTSPIYLVEYCTAVNNINQNQTLPDMRIQVSANRWIVCDEILTTQATPIRTDRHRYNYSKAFLVKNSSIQELEVSDSFWNIVGGFLGKMPPTEMKNIHQFGPNVSGTPGNYLQRVTGATFYGSINDEDNWEPRIPVKQANCWIRLRKNNSNVCNLEVFTEGNAPDLGFSGYPDDSNTREFSVNSTFLLDNFYDQMIHQLGVVEYYPQETNQWNPQSYYLTKAGYYPSIQRGWASEGSITSYNMYNIITGDYDYVLDPDVYNLTYIWEFKEFFDSINNPPITFMSSMIRNDEGYYVADGSDDINNTSGYIFNSTNPVLEFKRIAYVDSNFQEENELTQEDINAGYNIVFWDNWAKPNHTVVFATPEEDVINLPVERLNIMRHPPYTGIAPRYGLGSLAWPDMYPMVSRALSYDFAALEVYPMFTAALGQTDYCIGKLQELGVTITEEMVNGNTPTKPAINYTANLFYLGNLSLGTGYPKYFSISTGSKNQTITIPSVQGNAHNRPPILPSDKTTNTGYPFKLNYPSTSTWSSWTFTSGIWTRTRPFSSGTCVHTFYDEGGPADVQLCLPLQKNKSLLIIYSNHKHYEITQRMLLSGGDIQEFVYGDAEDDPNELVKSYQNRPQFRLILDSGNSRHYIMEENVHETYTHSARAFIVEEDNIHEVPTLPILKHNLSKIFGEPPDLETFDINFWSGQLQLGSANHASINQSNGNSTPHLVMLMISSDPGGAAFSTNAYSLILNMNGTSGTSVFTDSSQYNNTVTPVGGAVLSNVISYSGGVSCLLPSVGSYLDLSHTSSNFQFGFDDFTIRCKFLPTAFDSQGGSTIFPIINRGDAFSGAVATSIAYSIWYDTSTSKFYLGHRNNTISLTDGSGLFLATSIPVTIQTTSLRSTMYDFAVQRIGNNIQFFLDGKNITETDGNYEWSTFNFSIAVNNMDIGYRRGGNSVNGTINWTALGYFDDFVIIKGHAIYKTDFVPPTSSTQLPPNYYGRRIHRGIRVATTNAQGSVGKKIFFPTPRLDKDAQLLGYIPAVGICHYYPDTNGSTAYQYISNPISTERDYWYGLYMYSFNTSALNSLGYGSPDLAGASPHAYDILKSQIDVEPDQMLNDYLQFEDFWTVIRKPEGFKLICVNPQEISYYERKRTGAAFDSPFNWDTNTNPVRVYQFQDVPQNYGGPDQWWDFGAAGIPSIAENPAYYDYVSDDNIAIPPSIPRMPWTEVSQPLNWTILDHENYMFPCITDCFDEEEYCINSAIELGVVIPDVPLEAIPYPELTQQQQLPGQGSFAPPVLEESYTPVDFDDFVYSSSSGSTVVIDSLKTLNSPNSTFTLDGRSEWIQLDMGQVYTIDRIVVQHTSPPTCSKYLQYSIDGSNWITVYDVWSTNASNSIYCKDTGFTNSPRTYSVWAKARYIRQVTAYEYVSNVSLHSLFALAPGQVSP